MFLATLFIFSLGRMLYKSGNSKKSSFLTFFGVLIGVSLLLYFKYFNFFIDSFSSMLSILGLKSNIGTFDILMPLGISYFTFKLISYLLEIKRGKIEYCNDFISFATYIAFFPTILSGPIDKPNTFLPQLRLRRSFDYNIVVEGCRQVLWGLFQKIVIADNIAILVDLVWSDIPNHAGSTLFITTMLFGFQIYHDFSGYSNIAIGIGKILRFNITKNFNYPYFSRNVAEFWRNWHMSMTSWFTDYVYMPLSVKFRSLGKWGMIMAIMINMITIGIWHGDNLTYVLFGLYNGLLFVPLIITGSIFKNGKLKTDEHNLPTLQDFFKIVGTFLILTMGFVFFRAEDVWQAYQYFEGIFDSSFFSIQSVQAELTQVVAIFIAIAVFYLEWNSRAQDFPLSSLNIKYKRRSRSAIYYALILAIFCFSGTKQEFIYFQF